MTVAQAEEKKAVQSGYWHIYRYDPRLADAGKNPLTIDSKAPTLSYRDFLMGENRYNLLARANPERADMLFNMAEMQATKKLAHLQFLASQSFDDKEE
jgi:pyruvate-ferredoxin/flavodoxin oxidoreductase